MTPTAPATWPTNPPASKSGPAHGRGPPLLNGLYGATVVQPARARTSSAMSATERPSVATRRMESSAASSRSAALLRSSAGASAVGECSPSSRSGRTVRVTVVAHGRACSGRADLAGNVLRVAEHPLRPVPRRLEHGVVVPSDLPRPGRHHRRSRDAASRTSLMTTTPREASSTSQRRPAGPSCARSTRSTSTARGGSWTKIRRPWCVHGSRTAQLDCSARTQCDLLAVLKP